MEHPGHDADQRREREQVAGPTLHEQGEGADTEHRQRHQHHITTWAGPNRAEGDDQQQTQPHPRGHPRPRGVGRALRPVHHLDGSSQRPGAGDLAGLGIATLPQAENIPSSQFHTALRA